MGFFDLSHNHNKIVDKLIEDLNQSSISSNSSFSKNSKMENFFFISRQNGFHLQRFR